MSKSAEVIPVDSKAPQAPVKIFYTLVWLRKQAGLTQKQLADAIDRDVTTIAYWETGRRYPNPESLQLIAEYFDVSIKQLEVDNPTVEIAKQIVAEQVMLIHGQAPNKVSERDKNFLLQVIRTLTPQVLVEETRTEKIDEDGNKTHQKAVRRLAQYGIKVPQGDA